VVDAAYDTSDITSESEDSGVIIGCDGSEPGLPFLAVPSTTFRVGGEDDFTLLRPRLIFGKLGVGVGGVIKCVGMFCEE